MCVDCVLEYLLCLQDLRKCAADVMTSDSSTSSTAIWKTNLSRIHLLLRAQVELHEISCLVHFLSFHGRPVFSQWNFGFHMQAYLVQRFPQLVLSHDIESVVITLATPALRVCLAQTDDSPAEIIDVLGQTATVLRRCCRSTTRYYIKFEGFLSSICCKTKPRFQGYKVSRKFSFYVKMM